MIELLSPAGSPEAVIAAVQNGADAIYLGLEGFNARRGAKNFSAEDFEKAMRYWTGRSRTPSVRRAWPPTWGRTPSSSRIWASSRPSGRRCRISPCTPAPR